MNKHHALRACIALALAGLALAACKVDDPCDPDSTYEHGVCTPMAPDSGGAGDGDGDGDADDDAGAEEVDAAVDAEVEDPMSDLICPVGGDPSVYGRDCTTDADCECPANICLPLGYCTGTQCMEPGKECPGEMTCLDIAPFRDMASFPVPEEVTHICL